MSDKDEKSSGRSATEIVNQICEQKDKALEILAGLNDYEHEQMTNAPLLVALQRARGLACYETLAAYALAAEKEAQHWVPIVKDQRSRGDQLYGMLNVKAMLDKILENVNSDVLQDAYAHLDSLGQ